MIDEINILKYINIFIMFNYNSKVDFDSCALFSSLKFKDKN